jgi:hypothetical protein
MNMLSQRPVPKTRAPVVIYVEKREGIVIENRGYGREGEELLEEEKKEAEGKVDEGQEGEVEIEEGKIGEDAANIKKQRKPRATRAPKAVNAAVNERLMELVEQRKHKGPMSPQTLYLANRKLFIQKVNAWFDRIKPKSVIVSDSDIESEGEDAPPKAANFELLYHQDLIRQYLHIETPYRGLLLYHGLGSGKTCTAIAVAEGLKHSKRVFLLIPASLETNFYSEIRKCGDSTYKRQQFWTFVPTSADTPAKTLAELLSLPLEYVEKIKKNSGAKKQRGAWVMDLVKDHEPNYDDLPADDRAAIDEQLDKAVHHQYHQINYNASNLKRVIDQLAQSEKVVRGVDNPFDHSVILVDEAHKLVSTMVNKINQKRQGPTTYLYDMLLSAKDVRIVLMTGTPLVNTPNELSIMFNILRGEMKTWEFFLKGSQPSLEEVLELLVTNEIKTYDYVGVEQGKIRITRNPPGFVNQYEEDRTTAKGPEKGPEKKVRKTVKEKPKLPKKGGIGPAVTRRSRSINQIGGRNEFARYLGVKYDAEAEEITDEVFKESIIELFKANAGQIRLSQYEPEIVVHYALPETSEKFMEAFIDIDNVKNPRFLPKRESVFKKRIMGLSSYYLPIDEAMLPRLIKDNGDVFHYEYAPMSDYQFGIYAETRKTEYEAVKRDIKMRRMNRVQEIFGNSYRIYSRCNCNYVFPQIEGKSGRPFPEGHKGKEPTEENDDELVESELIDGDSVEDGAIAAAKTSSYKKRIEETLKNLSDRADEFLEEAALTTYSPKILRILANLGDPENRGLHLIYSQFRTLEGIGILRIIFLANGYAEIGVKRVNNTWELVLPEPRDMDKPRFMLYTGTESAEEREVLRNLYNGDWSEFPEAMQETLNNLATKNKKNTLGEIVKIIMITGSSAEGINLRNTRFVHLMEPFWHMVRLQQVIGRARRYKSHLELPEDMRNVKVFLYMASFSENQMKRMREAGEGGLIESEASKRDPAALFTSDQALFEVSQIKLSVSEKLLEAVKESSIDCAAHSSTEDATRCFTLGQVHTKEFASRPSLEEDIVESQGEDMKQRVAKTVVIQDDQGKDQSVFYYKDENDNTAMERFNFYAFDGNNDIYIYGVFDKKSKKLVRQTTK